jgi:hypothetical protein
MRFRIVGVETRALAGGLIHLRGPQAVPLFGVHLASGLEVGLQPFNLQKLVKVVAPLGETPALGARGKREDALEQGDRFLAAVVMEGTPEGRSN